MAEHLLHGTFCFSLSFLQSLNMVTSAAAALRLRAGPRATAAAALAAGSCLAAGTAVATALAASASTSSSAGRSSSGEEPRDAAGSLARGPRSVVQAPQPHQSLADPAEQPSGVLQRITEMEQVWSKCSEGDALSQSGWSCLLLELQPLARPPSLFLPLCRQNVFRPHEARPHAYHYAEDSAWAVVAEQLESGKGQPTLEAM